MGITVVHLGKSMSSRTYQGKISQFNNLTVYLKLEIEEQTKLMQVKKGNDNYFSVNQFSRRQKKENQLNQIFFFEKIIKIDKPSLN